MKIQKKILPNFFRQIEEGTKNFELRLADFECNPGDVIVLQEWDPERGEYTGRSIEKRVTCVIRTSDLELWPPDDVKNYGYQVIGFMPDSESKELSSLEIGSSARREFPDR